MKNIIRYVYYLFNSLRIIFFKKRIVVFLSSRIKYPNLLEGPSKVGRHTYLAGRLGRYSYIGENCSLNANIGSFCSIADNVKTVEGTHPLHFVSSSPAFYSIEGQCGGSLVDNSLFDDIKLLSTDPPVACKIESDVWIGENVLIKGGVTIGTGACVAMGAVVVKDIPPYAVVGGVPAKIIKMRFNNDTISKMLDSKWWEKDEQWLRNHVKDFVSPDQFLNNN